MNRKWNWVQAFPQSCAVDVRLVTRLLPRRLFRTTTSGTIEIACGEERLILPSRVYFEEVPEEKIQALTKRQRWLLYCLYTRHHDGYIREKYVRRLEAEQADADWVLPYLIELTGEYVYEILERIEPMLHDWSEMQLSSFVQTDDVYMARIEQRIISYWNLHQRTAYPILWDSSYVGFRIGEYYRLKRRPGVRS
ncbi:MULTISPECIES: hypothetical protein [Exiguobacterium]|uniref:hypothetical protein n=1 Tax=Exiguobacterium TaxID=33986 RepID=UPI0004797F6E|nr:MULTISPECIES: hypothetical protein [Exiguobacterium]MCT4780619.1 hypothetical protein [Exiguobacterium soli]